MDGLKSSEEGTCNNVMVSIILPTYNRAELLKLCIESVLKQTFQDWELIISDDGSSDNTTNVSKMFTSLDSRIRYNRNTVNQGLPGNRNIAISLARGQLIFFIEDDAILDQNCVKNLVQTYTEMSEKDERIGAIGPRLISGKKGNQTKLKKVWDYVGDTKRETIQTPCYFDKWTGIVYRNYGLDFGGVQEVMDLHALSIYPKSVYTEVGGYDSKNFKGTYFREEADYYFRIRKNGYKLLFQPKAIVYHNEVEKGGCSNFSHESTYYYYVLRNHCIFVMKNFGLKSIYMIPCFVMFLGLNTVRGVIALKRL